MLTFSGLIMDRSGLRHFFSAVARRGPTTTPNNHAEGGQERETAQPRAFSHRGRHDPENRALRRQCPINQHSVPIGGGARTATWDAWRAGGEPQADLDPGYQVLLSGRGPNLDAGDLQYSI